MRSKLLKLGSWSIKVVVLSYFDMLTDEAMGGAAVALSYAVFLTMLPTFDLGKAHGKTPKNNRDGFNEVQLLKYFIAVTSLCNTHQV